MSVNSQSGINKVLPAELNVAIACKQVSTESGHRILDKAEETESTEDAKKIARDIGLLQKIEAIKYNATLKENNPFHVKTLVAKGTALASQGNSSTYLVFSNNHTICS